MTGWVSIKWKDALMLMGLAVIAFPAIMFSGYMGIAIAGFIEGATVGDLYNYFLKTITYCGLSPESWSLYLFMIGMIYSGWLLCFIASGIKVSINKKELLLLFLAVPTVCYFVFGFTKIIHYASYEFFAIGIIVGLYLRHVIPSVCKLDSSSAVVLVGEILAGVLVMFVLGYNLKNGSSEILSLVKAIGVGILVGAPIILGVDPNKLPPLKGIPISIAGFIFGLLFGLLLEIFSLAYQYGVVSIILTFVIGWIGGSVLFSKTDVNKMISI